jgi:NAD(P)-dependent dehydrogenase (short-subunit alcohol dehydrogenase family)
LKEKKMKTVLITGASTGIGRECALDLSRAGWRVFAGVRKPADGQSLQAESSGGIAPLIIDVTDAESISRAAAQLESDLAGAGLDGLVNNAGISVQGPLEFLPLAMFEQQIKVNVTGQLAVTQAFLPLIRKARGRIVFMSSESGRYTLPLLGPYSASKFALEAVGNALRLELMPSGIRVVLIEPGSAKTPIWDKATKNSDGLVNSMPAQVRQYYAAELQLLNKLPQKMNKIAFSPKKVSRAVTHALTAGRPKIRYIVGAEARVMVAFYSLTPTRLADWITGKITSVLSRYL